MGIVKEYECGGHGPFETSDEPPRCPHGCNLVERAFRTAPAFHGGATRRTDALLDGIAKDYGLSNMRTGLQEGDTAKIQSPQARFAAQHQQAVRKRYPKMWGNLPDAKQGGAPAALAAYNAPPANSVESLKLMLTPKPVERVIHPEDRKQKAA